jgi:hypothetical protein
MYKTNIILRTVFFFAYIIAIILIGEKNLFWPILIYLSLITFKDRNIKSLILDVNILIILLFALYSTKISIFLKLISIVNLIILYIGSFTKGEIKNLKYNYFYSNVKNRKALFFNTYLEKIKDDNAKKYSNYSELAVGFRLNDDLVVTVKNNDYLTNTITVENKEDAIRYQIYKSTDNKTFTLLDTIDQTEENVVYIDKDVKYNKKYYYRVRAYNGVNYTAYNVVNVLTTKLKKPTVSTSGTIYSPTLEVKKVSQATGYEFYHSNDNTTWTKEQKSTSLTFEKEYDESETHYYRVRAYKKIDKKTYYSDFAYVSIEDFK